VVTIELDRSEHLAKIIHLMGVRPFFQGTETCWVGSGGISVPQSVLNGTSVIGTGAFPVTKISSPPRVTKLMASLVVVGRATMSLPISARGAKPVRGPLMCIRRIATFAPNGIGL
jgi:hypothetical protein